MKRYSEVVLNGHPDKFCDLVADRLVREAYKCDPEAYAQIEIAIWSDVMFLTGSLVTRRKPEFHTENIIHDLGIDIGYTAGNHIDVKKYKIFDHICRMTGEPQQWTHHSNDQSIVVGYAGYDAPTRYLPPEHFLCWHLREALIKSMQTGILAGHGPDGKILAVMQEEYSGWYVDTLLVTLQQQASLSFLAFTELVMCELKSAYRQLQGTDPRWCASWDDVRVLANPNGPLINGGSDGDNGQTGRKLVMDFYGPRIPIGGGALYGKDLSHIDRLGAMAARRFALEMVKEGAKEAMVRVCYAPGMDQPLNIDIDSDRRPTLNPKDYFTFESMRSRIDVNNINYNLLELGTFYNTTISYNSNKKTEKSLDMVGHRDEFYC